MQPSVQTKKIVLLVDPDEAFSQILREVLGSEYDIRRASTVEAGIESLRSDDLDVVLLNMDIPNGKPGVPDSRALLTAVSDQPTAPPVIVYSWDSSRNTTLEALQGGAHDFIHQPLNIGELKFALGRAHRRTALMRDLAATQKLFPSLQVEGVLGNSKAMARVKEVIRKVASVSTTVLITGESGTGKEVAARAIHQLGPRANKPFVAFSVSALPESLVEDELFGHERGAFTGALQTRRGRFEEANGGTIFLDEIGDLAIPVQAKLLRVLQERTVDRLGSNVAQPVDVRVICATNRNLEKMVREGTFREDLYFRISVVRVPMPRLRDREDDILLLAEYFLKTFARAHGKRVRGFTPGFLSALTSHGWPGNVRELQNVIERSLVLANGNERLGVEDLPPELRGRVVSDDLPSGSFHLALRSFKRELIRSALQMHSGNKLRAARELRISRCYLHRLLNQLNITEDETPRTRRPQPVVAESAEASDAVMSCAPVPPAL